MELKYRLTADDYSAYSRFLMETGDFKKKIRGQSLAGAGMVLLCGGAAMLIFRQDYLITAIAALAGAILIALLFPLIAKGGTKAALINSIKEDDGSMFREQTLTVNEEGVRVESSDGEETYRKEFGMEEIETLRRYEEIYLLTFTNGNLLIVPRSAFTEEGSEDSFREYFADKTA
ncbi:MAG: YcxB family protein [Clostridia bacterium]|nr:YcxB family protein [Clostridia bacterium]